MEMITTVKTTTNVVECFYLFVRDSTPVRGCRFIVHSFQRVAPVVIHIEPCGFPLSNKNRNAIQYE